ncbi:NADPH-dependent F420 reductase [Nocardioides baekrokdamisoli]|uniref:NADPH-dependent F420 reductase n=1 Tax=Nocardioides baekrokdamisoli TaxID=1804624 RepID=A0A3G9J436_9ACTN|nr:NADPH-dependent F420 reductase [Nocardioides baekrokdamisoli]BBH18398.1 NADPH-dependent F420 reductase [Nocardioides baekrokdamisoli]
MTTNHLRIAIIGGTGAQGKGLAARFAAAGHTVALGSRDAERAIAAAVELSDLMPAGAGEISGAANEAIADGADVIVVATPWDDSPTSVAWLAPYAAGKVVISCVNPLGFDKRGPYGLVVDAGSAAEHIAAQLPGALVAGAFHHVAAPKLVKVDQALGDDVLVASDDATAMAVTCELAATVAGRPGINAGALRMCRHLEPMTATLISINKTYKTHSGINISNVELASD